MSEPRLPLLRPWVWLPRVPRALGRETRNAARRFIASRHVFLAVVLVEYRKKYAGSLLGALWHPLYALLLLGMYCFIYLVVFQARYAEFGNYEYVLFIFAGLVPYLGFSDAVASATPSLRANLALLRNTVFPIELIPIRQVLVSFAGLGFSIAMLLALLIPTSFPGWHLLYLPVSLLLLLLFTAGLVWVLSALTVVVPDLSYIINLLLLLFMFVSPIGYSIEQVPASARAAVLLNPMTYLIDSFRFGLLGIRAFPFWTDAVLLLASTSLAMIGLTVFRTMMPVFSDYE